MFTLLRFAPICLLLSGCALKHQAEVKSSPLPPPPGEKVLHTGRLIVQVMPGQNRQCISYERYRDVCFSGINATLRDGLLRSLWPAFPEVVVGTVLDATPNDYVLQVEVQMDALPPDNAGPGWSAGAKTRFRVLRDQTTLLNQNTASRSRAEFAYGAPLGVAGTEVLDASILHIADAVSRIEEAHPHPGLPLPAVASKLASNNTSTSAAK